MRKPKAVLLTISALLIISVFLMSACGKKPVVNNEASAAPINQSVITDKEFEAFAKKIQAEIATHWPHMGKVWPGLDYDNLNVVLFKYEADDSISAAFLLNTKEMRSLAEKEYESLNPPSPGGYEKITFDGKNGISLSVSNEILKDKDSHAEYYRIATHEPIHFFYQDEIAENAEADRSQAFPIDRTPRLYRSLIYNNLILAYENHDKENTYLAHAKYWFNKWKTEFPEEYKAIKSTDIAEGIARYADNFGTFIGTAKTSEELNKNAALNIERNRVFLSADGESYEIGYVAALILDRKNPDWKKNFYASKMSADELLLNDIEESPEKADIRLSDEVTKTIEGHNAKLSELIEDLVKAKMDTAVSYLKIDITKSTGSMYATDMINYEGEQVSVGYKNTFTANGKTVALNDVNVYESFDDNGNQYLILPLAEPFDIKDNVLTVSNEKLSIEGVKVKTEIDNGRTIYSFAVSN